ncbi:hypothetical protein F7725_002208 [Dissostichus mawsoni]|uniref:Uncharacterized protein n=1 Tax=Dissostichus mawsoni TaxID=36200 RepID=A0A7J5Y3L1_DISMA|nr:hypothetical protein F7725_002208 [Dissostichus mawsoni]
MIIKASIYVVRKIRASIDAGEQLEKPITTPCSASAGHESRGSITAAALIPAPEEGVGGAACLMTSSGTSVQKSGSS